MDFTTLVETDRAREHLWCDMSELNYWARRVGFQEFDDGYNLVEVISESKI